MPSPKPASRSENSLDEFFYQNATSDLDNCDREPIHLIGSTQSAGALLIVDPKELAVIGMSQNAGTLLETRLPDAPPFSLPEPMLEIANEIAGFSRQSSVCSHTLLQATWATDEEVYQVVYHEHNELGYIEFLPERGLDVVKYRQKLRLLRQHCTQIMDAESFEEALDLAVEAGRKITEFARVKIYEFQPDWSGKVVAESKADHMPSYKGLFFPDTDIPKQARHLLTMVPYRGLATSEDHVSPITPAISPRTGKPFDLSWCLLRSASTMHTQYLRNMGINGTFTSSLVHRGKLWGIIAAHHDKPGFLPFDLWGAMQDLSSALMAKLDQQKAKDNEKMVHDLRAIEENVATIIRGKGDLESSIAEVIPQLRRFLRADGFAFRYGMSLHTDGATPPHEFIHRMLEWATDKTFGIESFATDSLHKQWEAAKEYADVACGVLIEPVSLHRVCHLIWFRAPVTKTAQWAGDPTKKETREEDGTRTLLPRNSFATWVQEHREQSEPWTEAEISAAREILKNMLDIVTSQIQLVRSNKNLETFSYAAAHDLKAPLRSIKVALDVIQQIRKPDEIEDMKELIKSASSSSARLQSLIDGMMSYLVLEKRFVAMEQVDLNEVVSQVCQFLQQESAEVQATIDAGDLPSLTGNRELFTTLFLNLIGNAIKYRDPKRKPLIEIGAKSLPSAVEISVQDNGLGISAEDASSIFEPLNRLHGYDEIPGNGLGLAICKRIVEILHGSISVDTSYRDGARIVLKLQR